MYSRWRYHPFISFLLQDVLIKNHQAEKDRSFIKYSSHIQRLQLKVTINSRFPDIDIPFHALFWHLPDLGTIESSSGHPLDTSRLCRMTPTKTHAAGDSGQSRPRPSQRPVSTAPLPPCRSQGSERHALALGHRGGLVTLWQFQADRRVSSWELGLAA